MANAVQALFDALTDEQLLRIVAEQRDLDDSGVLPEGETRALTRRLVEEIGMTHNDAQKVAWTQSMRCAAFRWLDQQTLTKT